MREEPTRRHHETYGQSHWSVVDIDGVDRIEAYPMVGFDNYLRIDIDGVTANSPLSDYDEGENVNTSIWLNEEEARQLSQRLREIVEDPSHRPAKRIL